jgi:hypothetical protein
MKLHKAKALPKFADQNKTEEVVLTVDYHPKDSKQEIPDEILFESLSDLQEPTEWENVIEEPKKQVQNSNFFIFKGTKESFRGSRFRRARKADYENS